MIQTQSNLKCGKGFYYEKNNYQVLISPNFGNGHWALSESAIFHYKQTTDYDRSGQFTILWNDPEYDFGGQILIHYFQNVMEGT